MQEIILKIRYFERGLSKALKKVTLFFLLNPDPLNRQSYQKQGGSGACDQTLFKLQKFYYFERCTKKLVRTATYENTKTSILVMF